MAKLTSFIHPEGEKVFEAKPAKDTITPRRNRIADSIDKLIEAAKAGEEKARGKVFEVRDNMAKAHVRFNGKNLVLEGQEFFYVAKDKLVDFYTEVKTQILAGEHDDAITALDSDAKSAATGKKASEGKRGGNYGWSAERLAKFQATKARQREEREKAKAAG